MAAFRLPQIALSMQFAVDKILTSFRNLKFFLNRYNVSNFPSLTGKEIPHPVRLGISPSEYMRNFVTVAPGGPLKVSAIDMRKISTGLIVCGVL